ncbi:nephrin-like isoform X2 [Zootermopsis nevadensis]|uniref:nephrin-like isoform X2 n=1 Tax=Zootermopsis nevadensis TaxID=136037 RepID=UPI000B8E78A7|nr:nephrin-like isoform X2 [Zootermopsis nevadensis]
MPCDIAPPIPGDKVYLVIWYKEGAPSPIYSFDSRGKSFDQAKHWADEQVLGGRAFFRYTDDPAKLTVESVRESDGGVYRCRVDFKKSPTRNTKVNLTVLIPPERLIILDDKGTNIPHHILGPYNEGSSVNITCIATGGRPSPRVTWWQENALLDDSYEQVADRRVQNVLRLEKLGRRHLHTVFTCQASNNNLVAPISSPVSLDMNLRPLWVRLQGENHPLSADNTYELDCEAVGARPPPMMNWWKGSIPLRNTRETTSPDGNTTTSTVTFVPTMEDSGKILTCRATTPLIDDTTLEDGWKLNIHHVPIVSLELGSNLNASSIREGIDVYFECNIKSNPWVYKVSWRHNGMTLFNNASVGTIVSNQSLVLQSVSRARAGLYTCVGSNQEGDGESNPVYLDVKFAPVCKPGQQKVHGVARQETVRIQCELEANPQEGIHFTWKFNNTAEIIDIAASYFTTDRARSTTSYTPMTELDYGTLLCWGRNDLGVQKAPCVFHIIPAGKPDGLQNCTILNQTAESLHVECTDGFDGGLPQEFVMEVYDAMTQNLVTNVTSRVPAFTISGLESGIGFDISLYAANSKGRSDSVPLHAYTSKAAEKRTAATPAILQITPILGVLIGVVAALVLLAVIIVVVMRLRGHGDEDVKEREDGSGRRGTPPGGDKACSMPLSKDMDESIDSMDEKNPDIIPQNSDTDYQDPDEKAFEKLNNAPNRIYSSMTPRLHSPPNNGTYENTNNIMNIPKTNDEITYAELSPMYGTSTLRRQQPHQEPTVYAQIDVSKKLVPALSSASEGCHPSALPVLHHPHLTAHQQPLHVLQQRSQRPRDESLPDQQADVETPLISQPTSTPHRESMFGHQHPMSEPGGRIPTSQGPRVTTTRF